MFAELVDICLPWRCVGCYERLDRGKIFRARSASAAGHSGYTIDDIVCPSCQHQLRQQAWLPGKKDNSWFLYPYQGIMRTLITRIKEHNDRPVLDFVVNLVADSIATWCQQWAMTDQKLILIPAPTRRKENELDVARALCQAVAQRDSERYRVACVCKLDSQAADSVGLTAEERNKNLRHHVYMTCSPREFAGLVSDALVVFVDDVMTSGATQHVVEEICNVCGVTLDLSVTVCQTG